MAKFTQNRVLASFLLNETGDTICEMNKHDRFFSTGLSIDHVSRENPNVWPGQNQLGQILSTR